MSIARVFCVLVCLSPWLFVGCGDDDDMDDDPNDTRPEDTGAACETAAGCYPAVTDRSSLAGEVQCLDRVDDGYCTHLCEDDADCCAAEGECKTGIKQVCSPFESTDVRMCFLSCEDEDLVHPDGEADIDENEYCQREASPDFICRSSGGGSQNRKVCVPGDCDVGEACSEDTDCASGLGCADAFRGGYCTVRDCTMNSDCPDDSACVERGGVGYCLKTCSVESDCGACRPWDLRGACTPDVELLEGGSARVCVPQ